MKRWHTFLVVAIALLIEGCGAAGGPNSTASTSPTMSTSLSAAAGSAATTPCPPATTPLPTLSAAVATASQAPAGAILVNMTEVNGLDPRFQPYTISARAGTVVFFLHNIPVAGGSPDHSMQIGPACTQFYSDGSIASGHVLAGTRHIVANESATFTVSDLAPGTYVFWCNVEIPQGGGNHAAAGMVGTLTVTP